MSKTKFKVLALFIAAVFIIAPTLAVPALPTNPFDSIPQREIDGVIYVPVRRAASAHSFQVAWDANAQAVIVTCAHGNSYSITVNKHGVFNDSGTVYMPLSYAVEIFSPSPLIGAWVWIADNNFTYIFNPDGTGERGFAELSVETFTWQARGMSLDITRTDHVPTDAPRHERYSFTIAHDTLTIVSRQFAGRVFSFVRM